MTIQFKIDDDNIDLSLNIVSFYLRTLKLVWTFALHPSMLCISLCYWAHTHTHARAQPHDDDDIRNGDNKETNNEKVLREKCVAPNFVMH